MNTKSTRTELSSAPYRSPVGELLLVASDTGLRALLWPGESGRVRLDAHRPGSSPVIDLASAQLDEYFTGDRREFSVPLDPTGTEFQRAVWEALVRIPYGSTTTYGRQAEAIGRPKSVRAVANANGKNPISIIVPCHRVIGSDGSLTGFAGGLDTKRWLLAHEGALLL